MERRWDEGPADRGADRSHVHECAVPVNPVFLLCRDEDRAQIMTRQHGLQISILRPNAVHTMFESKGIITNLDGFPASQSPANKLFIRFQDQRLQPALREMQSRAETCDPSTDDNDIRIPTTPVVGIPKSG